jgi:hypothetical protein
LTQGRPLIRFFGPPAPTSPLGANRISAHRKGNQALIYRGRHERHKSLAAGENPPLGQVGGNGAALVGISAQHLHSHQRGGVQSARQIRFWEK